MKIYVGYRYTGADKELLKEFLINISNILEDQGHSTFMYFRDGGNWEAKEGKMPLKDVISKSFEVIRSSDAALFLVQSNDFSEGMLLDIGCAISSNKPIYLAKKIGSNLPKTEAFAFKIIEFSDDADLLTKLKI
jgi:hypothetical protein